MSVLCNGSMMPLEMGSQKDRVPASCEHLGQLLRCKSRWGALCNSRRLPCWATAEATDDLFRHYTRDARCAPTFEERLIFSNPEQTSYSSSYGTAHRICH